MFLLNYHMPSDREEVYRKLEESSSDQPPTSAGKKPSIQEQINENLINANAQPSALKAAIKKPSVQERIDDNLGRVATHTGAIRSSRLATKFAPPSIFKRPYRSTSAPEAIPENIVPEYSHTQPIFSTHPQSSTPSAPIIDFSLSAAFERRQQSPPRYPMHHTPQALTHFPTMAFSRGTQSRLQSDERYRHDRPDESESECEGEDVDITPAQRAVHNYAQHNDMPSMSEIQTAFKVIPRFLGYKSKSPKIWLQKFNEFATMNGWNDAAKCYVFGLLLSGSASSWFSQLPEATKTRYRSLKKSFLATYGIDEAARLAHDVEFSALRQGESENVESFIEMIMGRAADLNKSESEIKDAILRGLQPQIQAYVVSRGPRTLPEVITEAKVGAKLYPHSSTYEMQKILKALEELKSNQREPETKEKRNSVTLSRIRQEQHGQLAAYDNMLSQIQARQDQNAYQLQTLMAKVDAQATMPPSWLGSYATNAVMKDVQMDFDRYNSRRDAEQFPYQNTQRAGNAFRQAETRPRNAPSFNRNNAPRPFNRIPPGPRGTCFGCGSTQHARTFCPFRNAQCHFCKDTGHIMRVCRKAQQSNQYRGDARQQTNTFQPFMNDRRPQSYRNSPK